MIDFKVRRVRSKVACMLVPLVAALVMATPGLGHTNIPGNPRYLLEEGHPHAPALKLVECAGTCEIRITSYPGRPQPGERTALRAAVVDKRSGQLSRDRLLLFVFQQGIWGSFTPVPAPVDGQTYESGVRFFPVYPAEGNYVVLLVRIEPDGNLTTLWYPLVVGNPGDPWAALGGFFWSLAMFFVVIRIIKKRRTRSRCGGSP